MTADQSLLITARYTDALGWAAKLHLDQRRQGKDVPYISHVIAVSSLVWEDGGSENQAIAALLHDAIEDAGQSHASISLRFGGEVADIVFDCTDPGKHQGPSNNSSWLGCKQAFITTLEHKPESSLLVVAADKAHNARDHLFDGRRDPNFWLRTPAGLLGWVWYFKKIHELLDSRLPGSRSVELLGLAVRDLISLPEFALQVPVGMDPSEWASKAEGNLDKAVGLSQH